MQTKRMIIQDYQHCVRLIPPYLWLYFASHFTYSVQAYKRQ